MRPRRTHVAASLAISAMVIAAFGALAIGPASAKRERADLKFKKTTPNVIVGKLKTNVRSCRANRKVVVKFEPASARTAARKTKLGTAKTNKKGKWRLRGSFSDGKYTAIAKPKKIKRRALPPGRKEEELEEEEAEDADEDEANFARTGPRCTRTRTRTRTKFTDRPGIEPSKTVGPFSGPLFPCNPGFFIDVYIDEDAEDASHMILDNEPCPPTTTVQVERFDAGTKPPGTPAGETRWEDNQTYRLTFSSTTTADALPFRIKVSWQTP